MSKEMNITIVVNNADLNEKIANKFIPNEEICLEQNCIKFNVGDKEKKFTIEKGNVKENGKYYIELVKAKLNYFDESKLSYSPYGYSTKTQNVEHRYKYNGLIIQLFLSKEKRNLNCKIYNAGNYNDEISYKYLTNENTYKELYELSTSNTKKIVNKNLILEKEYSDKLAYQIKLSPLQDFFYSRKDEYYIYRKSNITIDIDCFNNVNSYIKRLNDRLNTISDNVESLLRHKYDFNNYFYSYNDNEQRLIKLAEKEYGCIKVYCDKGWTGDLDLDKLLYYMTYINMHTLNGVIFSDDELNLKEIDCYAKVDLLGQYVCIDNEYSVNYFKNKYNIVIDEFKIGKYVIIGPKHLEKFTKDYLIKYATHIFANKKEKNLLKNYEDFQIKMCENLTKLTFLHELGHMAFTGSNITAKRESDESAANWFASIGLNVVEKYRIFLKTRLQPDEYKIFFTNPALLPGGKLFENSKEMEKTCEKYDAGNDILIIEYKDNCNLEYYKKVKDMIEDMYIS